MQGLRGQGSERTSADHDHLCNTKTLGGVEGEKEREREREREKKTINYKKIFSDDSQIVIMMIIIYNEIDDNGEAKKKRKEVRKERESNEYRCVYKI